MTDVPAKWVSWLVPERDVSELRTWSRWAGLVQLGYLVVRAPTLVSEPATWAPVGVLTNTGSPLPRMALLVMWVTAVAWALTLAIDTRRTARALSPVGAIALLLLLTHRSSSGQVLWFDILMVLHLVILAIGAMSDNRLLVGWVLRLGGLVTVITYVLAGIAKLRIGGTAWVAQGALERHIAWSATRLEVLGGTASPLAGPLVELGIASTPLALVVLAIELGAPIALLNRRLAIIWAITAWTMHVGIAASMFVVFHWPLTGAAFVPLVLAASRDERGAATPGSEV